MAGMGPGNLNPKKAEDVGAMCMVQFSHSDVFLNLAGGVVIFRLEIV